MADGVRFYQAQSFFKEPGDSGSSFHSDNYACPLDTSNQLTTAWIPLVQTDRNMGMLAFARGSHADMNLNFWCVA
jgi:ectoine hydroxylase-related dioxygenase (phytanoyl-CoA dioxygenase family)